MKNILYILLLLPLGTLAQDNGKVLVASQKVGPVIDQTEKRQYQLFMYMKDAEFQMARFVQMQDSSIIAEITKTDGSVERNPITEKEWATIVEFFVDVEPKQVEPLKVEEEKEETVTVEGYGSIHISDTAAVYRVITKSGSKYLGNIVPPTIKNAEPITNPITGSPTIDSGYLIGSNSTISKSSKLCFISSSSAKTAVISCSSRLNRSALPALVQRGSSNNMHSNQRISMIRKPPQNQHTVSR